MKRMLWGLVVLAVLAAATDPAFARRSGRAGGKRSGSSAVHHHVHTRVMAGGGFFRWSGPWYLAPGFAVMAPEQSYPVWYVEKREQDASGPALAYWYYCPEANGYYPEIQSCPEGWQEFVSRAP